MPDGASKGRFNFRPHAADRNQRRARRHFKIGASGKDRNAFDRRRADFGEIGAELCAIRQARSWFSLG